MIEVGERGRDRAAVDAGGALEEMVRRRYQMEAVASMAGRVAHELNNLFTLVQGSIWRLSDLTEKGGEAALEVSSLRRSVDAASGLTRDLLAYSRQQVLDSRVYDLNDLVESLIPRLRSSLGDSVEVMFLREPGPASAGVDAEQLGQALFSIVENAGLAMPDGGLLTLEVSEAVLEARHVDRYAYPVEPGRYVRITVSDTGVGMSGETVERAFEPFFTTRPAEGRFGLGLSSAYGIIKQSGGYIWLDSEQGIGTTVSIYLPWTDGDSTEPAPPPALPELRAGGPPTILVVEDNTSVRAMVVRLLLRKGFSVVEAADGREALSIVEGYPAEINLVLTDVMMPNMDGRELVETLRLSRPNLRALYMSGYAQKASMRTRYIAASDAFVAKPFDPETLISKVTEVLAHVPARVR
jgi:two-component system, cell cycle sensor histidine kinase and response regulator CckA